MYRSTIALKSVIVPKIIWNFSKIPQFQRLKDPLVWLDAAIQIFYSLGVAYGSLIAFSSYNPIKNDSTRDAITVCLINCATSIYASVVVFCFIGFQVTTLVWFKRRMLEYGLVLLWLYRLFLFRYRYITEHTEYQFPKEQILWYPENRIGWRDKNWRDETEEVWVCNFSVKRRENFREHDYRLFCLFRRNRYSVYSINYAIGSRIDGIRLRSFRNQNRSQKNTITAKSVYSHSGIVPKECALYLFMTTTTNHEAGKQRGHYWITNFIHDSSWIHTCRDYWAGWRRENQVNER